MQDITLGVALGSAAQISMFVVRFQINKQKPKRNWSFSSTHKLILSGLNHLISGSLVCDCCMDNGYQYGSWLQPPRDWFPGFFNYPHSLHSPGFHLLSSMLNCSINEITYARFTKIQIFLIFAGWNLTLHERDCSVSLLCNYWRVLFCPPNCTW